MFGAEHIAVQALLVLLYLLGCVPQTYMRGSGDRPSTPTPQISMTKRRSWLIANTFEAPLCQETNCS